VLIAAACRATDLPFVFDAETAKNKPETIKFSATNILLMVFWY
jgi:hypothetical protein